MARAKVAVTTLCLLLAASFLLVAINPNTFAVFAPTIIRVPTDSPTIQGAVNMANQGDTIQIEAGTFRENVVINKTVTLIGFATNATFIKAANTLKPALDVRANNVSLSGFTVQNGLIGIAVYGFNLTLISNIAAISNARAGIEVDFSHNSRIVNSTISSNSFEGLRLGNSTGNFVGDNSITQNKNVGIELDSSSNNRVTNNTVAFHNGSPTDQGIWLQESADNNTFSGNTFLRNSKGIDIYSSGYNLVYINNFLNNSIQANRDEFSPSNFWDNGTVGNYWSDYNGSGPYPISYTGDVDHFPLVVQPNPITDKFPPITVDDYDGTWHNTDFAIKLTASDDLSGVNQTYYKINGGLTEAVSANGQPLITNESANNTLEYWSTDLAGHEEIPHHVLTAIKLDKTLPSGSIAINTNASYTTSITVILNLSASDAVSGVFQMRFSNNEANWTAWEPYATSKTWNLTGGDGVKKVETQFLDKALLASPIYSVNIVLDTLPPVVMILSPSNSSQFLSSTVTVEWNGTDAGMGIDHYEVQLDTAVPINVGTELKYEFTGLSDGNHVVKIIAFDKVGHSQEVAVSFSVVIQLIWYIGIALAAVIIAVVIAVYFFKIRKNRLRQKVTSSRKDAA